MKIIITENRLVKMIDRILGHSLSNHIETITSFYELTYGGKFLFSDGKEECNWLLNHYGPMFRFYDIDGRNFLVQKQGSEWWIAEEGTVRSEPIDYTGFLNLLGVGDYGIPLDVIIDNYINE